MRTPVKIGAYGLGLVAIFGTAWGVGTVVGPAPAPAAHAGEDHADRGHGAAADHGVDPTTSAGQDLPGGLQVAQDGYRIEPVTEQLSVGQPAVFAFRLVGPDGSPVTRYTPTHDKELHLVVVRRDLSVFQHVHPTMAADGTWAIPLSVAGAGQYRLFADFQPAGRAEALTLGVDVPAAGVYQPANLPAPAHTATIGGYTVTLDGDLVPGTASKLTLTVSKDGHPVTDLQPQLAAYGHLVALRDGDLAYLHVHPDGEPGDGRTRPGPDVTFYAQVPSAGTYRLFLDFQHGGTVRTAEFTALAVASVTAPPGHARAVPRRRSRWTWPRVRVRSDDGIRQPAAADGPQPDRVGDRRHDL